MPNSLPKIIASILLGMVFFFGGAGVASAAWKFNYTTKASPSAVVSSSEFPIKPDCDTQRALFQAATTTYDNVYTCQGADTVVAGGAGSSSSGTTAASPNQYYLIAVTAKAPVTGSVTPFTTYSGCAKAMAPAVSSGFMVQCTSLSSPQQAQDVLNKLTAAKKTFIEKTSGPTELKNFSCGIGLTDKSTLTGCIPTGVFYLIYKPASIILAGTSYLFDIVLNMSIRKEFVVRPFIDSSWTIMRDFSNMAFIFVLLYTGIATMLGTPGWAKTVRNVVIIALLINFSLFFTKVVIDAGNIIAVGVHEAIMSGSPNGISTALVKGFTPQAFLGKTGELSDAMDAIVIFLIAAIINGYAAYIFFKAALLFFGRLIAFWFLMIVSPFAFISITLPKGNVFNGWLDTLLKQSFVAPVYLFLLYLILQIINSEGDGLLGGANLGVASGSFIFDKLIAPIIMATLILFALQQALKMAEKMAGDFGAMGSKMAGAIIGTGLSLATGGTAGVLRAGVGGMAARSLQRGMKTEAELAAMSERERSKYQSSRARMQTLSQSSFDVRSLAGEKSILGKTVGGMISKGGGAFGVDVGKATLGGVEKAAKDAEKKAIDNVPKLSIFEEKEIERRAIEKAEKNKGELPALENFLDTATKATEEQAKLLKALQEQTEQAIKQRENEYTVAQQRVERDKGTEYESESLRAMAEAKDYLDKTKADQGIAIKSKVADLENTKKKQDEAAKAVTDAKKSVKTITGEVIKTENDRRRNEYADKVERNRATIPFTGAEVPINREFGGTHAQNTRTANKIRSGEESGYAKKLKELTKKKEKAVEEGKSEEYVAAIEDQIKETKGDVKKEEEMKK